eukprot:2034118-Rhodomonas_salina.2
MALPGRAQAEGQVGRSTARRTPLATVLRAVRVSYYQAFAASEALVMDGKRESVTKVQVLAVLGILRSTCVQRNGRPPALSACRFACLQRRATGRVL